MTTPTENADFLVGSNAFDFINGLGGDDFISGLGDDDLLLGGEGNDILVGGRGDDTLNGGNGNDTANYNDSEFDISANLNTGSVIITAGDFTETDTLLNIENITGGGGYDTIVGNASVNRLSGMAGNDNMTGGGGADKINGGDGFDIANYAGTASGVSINLLTGICSGGDAEGDKLVNIEAVSGWNFNDTLKGNDEENSLAGGAGKDTLIGGGGDDSLSGGAGADIIAGGSGIDILYCGHAAAQIDLLNHTATGTEQAGDKISGVENISGSFFDDKFLGDGNGNQLAGGFGKDTLNGRDGADYLFGQGDNDILLGGNGADTLAGGEGRDVMTGGTQSDLFRFDTIAESGLTAATRDLVNDFITGVDQVGLSLMDANSTIGGNQLFDFIEGAAFTGTAGQLRMVFSGGNTILEGDVDGNKSADFQIEFVGQLTFTDGDFFL